MSSPRQTSASRRSQDSGNPAVAVVIACFSEQRDACVAHYLPETRGTFRHLIRRSFSEGGGKPC